VVLLGQAEAEAEILAAPLGPQNLLLLVVEAEEVAEAS
jgi:hypothetical protein